MRLRKNIIVLDTETTGDFKQPLIHDIGYVIIDKDFHILKTVRYLVKNVRDCLWALNYSEFYRSKSMLYDFEIENGNVEIKPWNEIINCLKKDISYYSVNIISAYNVAFDFTALNFTNHFLNNGDNYFEKLLDKNMFLCIWNMACDTILSTNEYKEWCKTNNKLTNYGNYITNAETAYQYITNDLDFKEDHTSLSDAKIETNILKYIVENYKGTAKYGLMYNVWKKVQ